MNITVRKMNREDLPEALEVEKSAVRGTNQYLADVFDYYTSTKGELSVACVDDKVVGIGKFTVLFDGSAWLELLRVHQDYQKQGVGTAIYQRYFEQMDMYHLKRAALYTGIRNIGSCTLAKNFGLSQECGYISFSAAPQNQGNVLPFKLSKAVPEMPVNIAHLNINHTFYPVNEATLGGFLSQGWIYTYQDTVLIMGSRFQPTKALYIAYISGSYQREAIAFALHLAAIQGIEKVTYHFPSDKPVPVDLLDKFGFIQDPGEDIIMSIER